jgi:siderophore synthetase component
MLEEASARALDPVEFMQRFAGDGAGLPNLAEFLQELQDSVTHTALSLEAGERFSESGGGTSDALLRMEQLSALRDRPFHPTARAKRGFSEGDYRAYSSEFGNAFELAWLALRRDHVKKGDLSGAEIAEWVLQEPEQRQLQTALAEKGLDAETYLAMPVHPWQMEHVLPDVFAEELRDGILVPLDVRTGRCTATSSLRALSREAGGGVHVKVPIGIYSLAALRILPLRYLHNAERAQGVLQQVIAADPWLSKRLHLCDESRWWGFHDPDGDAFADKPGQLACLIRRYPSHLLEEAGRELIAMSAFAVIDGEGRMPAFANLLTARGVDPSGTRGAALQLFCEIAEFFIAGVVRCFRYGLMPEVHGQNVMLAFRAGRVDGMLLRDHDTIRLYLPWLEREGFADPGYVVKPGTPNSLLNPTPEALLSYFQTLGVQVNLYAIADAISRVYGVEEAELWRAIRIAVESCLRQDLPADVRAVLQHGLLEKTTWPTRTLITPLLQRVGSGGGSMPAGVGVAANPLLEAGR